jgi:hypothetical protein
MQLDAEGYACDPEKIFVAHGLEKMDGRTWIGET